MPLKVTSAPALSGMLPDDQNAGEFHPPVVPVHTNSARAVCTERAGHITIAAATDQYLIPTSAVVFCNKERILCTVVLYMISPRICRYRRAT